MALVGSVLFYFLQIFILVMWVRLIVDFIRAARPDWRPAGPLLVLLSIVFAVTDPPIKLVRKVIKPLRFGAISIDFAWTIVIIVAFILSNVAASIGR